MASSNPPNASARPEPLLPVQPTISPAPSNPFSQATPTSSNSTPIESSPSISPPAPPHYPTLLPPLANTSAPNPQLLNEQLQAFINDPLAFGRHMSYIKGLSRKASIALETAYDTHHRIAYGVLPLIVGRIGQEKGIFSLLVDNTNAGKSTSIETIADKTGIKTFYLHTLLSYMAAQNMIEQEATFQYRASPTTSNLLQPFTTHGLPVFQDVLLPAFYGIRGAMNCGPLAPFEGDTGFKIGHGTEFQEWMNRGSNAGIRDNFFELLKDQWKFRQSCHTDKELIGKYICRPGDCPTGLLVVDIGGGYGTTLLQFLNNHVTKLVGGRIVPQDREEVIEKAKLKLTKRIETMSHDYFKPQPQTTQGAGIYYMRQILHTNTDTDCLKILTALVPAMQGHSHLIIDEKVFPYKMEESDWSFKHTAELSMAMLACFNTVERRKGDWTWLLEKAGYEVLGITPYSTMHDDIIVARLKKRTALP